MQATYAADPLQTAWLLRDLPDRLVLDQDFVHALDYARRVELYVPQYLAEVAVRPNLDSPSVASFLDGWSVEEVAHGTILTEIIRRADPSIPTADAIAAEDKLRLADEHASVVRYNRRFATMAPHCFVGAHMTIGVLNEWLTQMAYLVLADLSGQVVVGEALRAIAKQEARHAAFYRQQAHAALDESRCTRMLVRFYLRTGRWQPVGRSIHAEERVQAFARFLATHPDFDERVRRVDERVSRLPGLHGLKPLRGFLDGIG